MREYAARAFAKDAVPVTMAAAAAQPASPLLRPFVQTKLAVGRVDDPLEREADRFAAEVVSRLAVHRSPWNEHEHEDDDIDVGSTFPAGGASVSRIARRATPAVAVASAGPDGGELSGPMEAAARSGAGGRPLDGAVRSMMEPAFGADFGAVRVHTDSALAPRISATAFTLGRDVHFAPGAYRPESRGGQEVLAHELTHVVQQGAAPAGKIRRAVDAGGGLRRLPRRVDRTPAQRELGPGQITTDGVGSRIQRFPGVSYYLLCAKGDKGAQLVDNDVVKPPRYYRTVDALPSGAIVAADQPFKFWNLYALPGATDTGTNRTKNTSKKTTKNTNTNTNATKRPTGKTSTKKVTTKAAVVDLPASSSGVGTEEQSSVTPTVAQQLAPTKPELSFEDTWKDALRKRLAAENMQPLQIEAMVTSYAKRVEKAPIELATAVEGLRTAWRAEFTSGVERLTLDERIATLQGDMPTWNGDVGTLQNVLSIMEKVVTSARNEVQLLEKAAKLSAAVGAECFTDLLSQWSLHGAVGYADGMTLPRLVELMTVRKVGAEALKHYGVASLRYFRGAGPDMWTHLTEAELNSKKDISGAHDDRTFRRFLRKVKYAIIDDPYPEAEVVQSFVPKPSSVGSIPQVATVVPERAAVYTVRYTEAGKDGRPVTGGAVAFKTLIYGLSKNEAIWKERFNQAIWRSIAAKEFDMGGGLHFASDDAGQRYEFRYTKGRRDVDTLFPAHVG